MLALQQSIQISSADFPQALSETKIRATQTGSSRTLFKLSQHVEMVCVRHFRSPYATFNETSVNIGHNGIWA